MTINFESDDLNLCYLVAVDYTDADGSPAKAYWCGPKSRCGGGLVALYPPTGDAVQYEGRLSGGRLRYTVGGLTNAIAQVSDFSARVDASEALATEPVDLLKQARLGYWSNRKIEVWLYDRNAGTYQHAGTGKIKRNPNRRNDGGFSISAWLYPFEPDLRWPGARVPDDTSAFDSTATAGLTDEQWHPTTGSGTSPYYRLNPEHVGKFRGHVFGGSDDGVWIEGVPYGIGVSRAYVWVSPREECFVYEARWTSADGVMDPAASPFSGETMRTFFNRDSTRGPLGTCVKISYASGSSTDTPKWWALPDGSDGKGHRIWLRVKGHAAAEEPVGFDEVLDPFVNSGTNANHPPAPDSPGAIRSLYSNILEDLLTDPAFLNLSSVFGVGSLAAFTAAEPSSSAGFRRFECAVPLELTDEAPKVRDVIEGYMLAMQADLHWRYDAASAEMRLFPLWRGPRSTDSADWTITEHDLTGRQQPRPVAELDDPDGSYVTRCSVRSADFYQEPNTGEDAQLEIKTRFARSVIDAAEEAANRFAGIRSRDIQIPYWVHGDHGDASGHAEAADFFADHLTQRQRAHEVTMGRRGYRVQSGDIVKLDVSGYDDSLGQVRSVDQDLDAVAATIRSYHIEAFEGAGKGE